MATPEVQLQQPFITMRPSSPGSVRFNTFNPDGTVLDVHTGYTVTSMPVGPASSANPDIAPPDLSAHSTAAFDTSGVTISWSFAQMNTFRGLLQSLQNNYVLFISNDSGTTTSALGQGSLQLDNANGLND